jgi:nitroreductase
MTDFDLAITDRLLTTTRSVRKRLDLARPVPQAVIRTCLEIALQAPSGGNRQGWRWIVVTAPATRAALADIYRKGAGSYLDDRSREVAAGGSAQDRRVFDSARYLADRLQDVPVHVIPCIRAEPPPATAAGFAWPSLMGSIFPAVWSFQLALRARGLGSVLTTLHLRAADEAAALLGIPAGVVQVGLVPVAYTVGTDFKPAERRPLDEVVHWERW